MVKGDILKYEHGGQILVNDLPYVFHSIDLFFVYLYF